MSVVSVFQSMGEKDRKCLWFPSFKVWVKRSPTTYGEGQLSLKFVIFFFFNFKNKAIKKIHHNVFQYLADSQSISRTRYLGGGGGGTLIQTYEWRYGWIINQEIPCRLYGRIKSILMLMSHSYNKLSYF